MKIIVIRVGDFKGYPPSMSLINALLQLGHDVCICGTKDSQGFEKSFGQQINVHYVDYRYADHNSIANRMANMPKLSKLLWNYIDREYDKDSIIWCEDDITIKHLGYKLLDYNYIIRLDELNESLYYTRKFKMLHMDTSKIGNNALAVVVPEYNRAHITKAWWGLKETPRILPNKPLVDTNIDDYNYTDKTKEILKKIQGRKIILYQGGLGKERPIEPFVKAVENSERYAFVIMTRNPKDLNGDFKNCFFIEYIQPPYHLAVTKLAQIGIIAYTPDKEHNSVLNTYYCAPNKLFEYSKYGIPILSNDLPGLQFVYNKYKCGIAVSELSDANILKALEIIDNNYNSYSEAAKCMYESIDIKKIVDSIIENAAERIKDPINSRHTQCR